MQTKKLRINSAKVDYHFSEKSSQLKEVADPANAIVITDENVFGAHQSKFKNWRTIVLKAGEEHKVQKTVDDAVRQLIEMQADRKTTLIGVGGGVVTDLTGYVSAIYMRGISFGFVPTSVLAMVDASIGGKNGIDVGVYKNMIGTIRQPGFILFDPSWLVSLPEAEWRNGFAEIIKHAAIKDAPMFKELEDHNLAYYQKKKNELAALIQRNALLKTKVVQQDELEKGERKLLNFGHTLGHALENQYDLSHGQAISIGMGYASKLSEKMLGFQKTEKLVAALRKYELPTSIPFDKKKVMTVLQMDKKREKQFVNFILLERIGKAVVRPVSIRDISETI